MRSVHAQMRFTLIRRIAVLALIIFAAAGLSAWPANAEETPDSSPAKFVGTASCARCHAPEAERWKKSHHAKAMQAATPATVLGDFANATLTHHGVVTTFSGAKDKFMVRTEGPDGAPHDYEIAYTFGVHPLQQYLIAFPGGRYQALGIAWDSRPKAQGGQRWLPLYPDQTLKAGERLHWTGVDQTWNYQCANCHSTNLQKNYDLSTNSYATSWADVDVACEACHGPGSRHVAWAKAHAASPSGDMGLVVRLAPADHAQWRMNAATGTAERGGPLASQTAAAQEIDVCSGCHARRKAIAKNPLPGAPFLNSYLPALLEPGLYHADGQIDGEVFEYGSFLQSRMHRAGVACSNCHEPHGGGLRAEGNALCGQCHLSAKFDAAEHHHHQGGGAGAQCVNCHMPPKTYMVVDERRDHGIRVPRPDLAVAIGAPDACTQCHADKTPDWAAQKLAVWHPNGRQTQPHFGLALHAGQTGAANAESLLDALILDRSQPAIARASALPLLPPFATPASQAAIEAAIADPDPLVRAAAPRALPAAPARAMVQAMAPLLGDSVRAVRIEAARALAGADQQMMTPEQQTAFAAAYLELFDAEMLDADRPEAHLNLGLLETRMRRPAAAEEQYRTALRLDPNFIPALVNLADLDRMRGRDEQGAELIRKALTIEPNNADIRHSLGLLLVRRRNYAEALPELRKASELAPGNARYAYVYAIALNSIGAREPAMELLEQTHKRHPSDRDVLLALVSLARESGDLATALTHARELSALYPTDIQLRMLILDLEKRQAR
ncbi:tetratricopeptide repeat protein [Methylocapsa aurea]|uniref:tetratricopeptide repeat protein n=1 Tax=Methylocapsa aurea TaxID=663610 RepID=UPI000ADC7D26|nr:multiheme c-type cytochrome [Methylocapsa aurea]